MLPATAEVITGFVAAAEEAPEELFAVANVMKAPPMPFVPAEHHGKPVLMALMVYAGNAEAGERAVAPFRALATPLADMVKPIRYPEMYEGPEARGRRAPPAPTCSSTASPTEAPRRSSSTSRARPR